MAKRASTGGKPQHQRLLEIASLFEVKEKRFDGNSAKQAAEQLRDRQQALHLQFLESFKAGKAGPASHLGELVDLLRAHVARTIHTDYFSVSGVGTDGPAFSLQSRWVPILTEDTIAIAKAMADRPDALPGPTVIDLLLGAYIGATAAIGRGQPVTAAVPVSVAYAQIQLQVAVQFRDGALDVRAEAEDMLAALVSQSDNFKNRVQQTFYEALLQSQNVNEQVASALGDLVRLKAESDDASARVDALKADFEGRYTGAESRALAFLEGIRARVETKELRKHWDHRARDARRAWVISGVFLAFLFVVVPIAVLYHASDLGKWALRVLKELGTDGDSEGALLTINLIGKLFIISAPALLFSGLSGSWSDSTRVRCS